MSRSGLLCASLSGLVKTVDTRSDTIGRPAGRPRRAVTVARQLPACPTLCDSSGDAPAASTSRTKVWTLAGGLRDAGSGCTLVEPDRQANSVRVARIAEVRGNTSHTRLTGYHCLARNTGTACVTCVATRSGQRMCDTRHECHCRTGTARVARETAFPDLTDELPASRRRRGEEGGRGSISRGGVGCVGGPPGITGYSL